MPQNDRRFGRGLASCSYIGALPGRCTRPGAQSLCGAALGAAPLPAGMRIGPRKEPFAMKRALVLLLAVAALVAGCGSSSGSGSGGSSGGSSVSTATAAGVLDAASSATKDATSAAFDAKLGIKLGGQLAGAGAGAALLQGPLSLELKGHAGKATGGTGKFDVDFALNYTGGSFSGEALSPDGKTLYVKMPLLMGPGWHSLPLGGLNSQSPGSSPGSSATSGPA